MYERITTLTRFIIEHSSTDYDKTMPICISFMVYNVVHVDFAILIKLLQIYDMIYMRHGVAVVLCGFDKQDNSCLAMTITVVILRVLALVVS